MTRATHDTRPRPCRGIALAASLACISVVTSCTKTSNTHAGRDTTMTPEQAVTALYDFYAKTTAQLGAKDWQPVPPDANVLGHIPEECGLADGSKGVRYIASLDGPGQPDPESAARRVATYWRSFDLAAEVRVPTNAHDPQILAVTANFALRARYTVDTVGSSISLVGRCVPGDQDALYERVIEHREQESASPTPVGPGK